MIDLDRSRTPRGIRIEELCKHLFVCGVPGSGKTTSIFSILLQLHERGIPFLVIETAKKEYRTLKALRENTEPTVRGMAETLEIYTAGMEHVSPLRFNPLWRPGGVDPDGHIDALLRCFKGAMPMFEPLPALLGEAIEMVVGADKTACTLSSMSDLYETSRRVLDGKGYSADVKSDMSAAMEVRLGTLTRRTLGAMLGTTTCVPDVAHLATSHCILEVDELDVEVKCLLTLLLLTAIHRHIRLPAEQKAARNVNPRLVIVLEEAHNIVGRSTDAVAAENQANPKAYATELICRMLAEFRALGVGIILIDQLPSQMAPQVIKNTGTKLAFRQVARDDREMLADTMLFGDFEYEDIARLLPGEAYLYAEGYHRAHRLRTPNLADLLSLPNPPTDEELVALIRDDDWYQEARTRQAADVLLRFQLAMDRYGRQKDQVNRELEGLLHKLASVANMPDADLRCAATKQLANAVGRVGARITAAYTTLEQRVLGEARRITIPRTPHGTRLESLLQTLLRRFEQVIHPQFTTLRDLVERKVAQLKSGVFHTEDCSCPKTTGVTVVEAISPAP